MKHVPLTEAQELTALEQIRGIVADLGPSRYLTFTLAGVLEVAEENIRNDLLRNPMDRIHQLEKKLAALQETGNEVRHEQAT